MSGLSEIPGRKKGRASHTSPMYYHGERERQHPRALRAHAGAQAGSTWTLQESSLFPAWFDSGRLIQLRFRGVRCRPNTAPYLWTRLGNHIAVGFFTTPPVHPHTPPNRVSAPTDCAVFLGFPLRDQPPAANRSILTRLWRGLGMSAPPRVLFFPYPRPRMCVRSDRLFTAFASLAFRYSFLARSFIPFTIRRSRGGLATVHGD